jgi:hypothetical protein
VTCRHKGEQTEEQEPELGHGAYFA